MILDAEWFILFLLGIYLLTRAFYWLAETRKKDR